MTGNGRTEQVRMMELSRADLKELLLGARERATELEKIAKKLRESGCHDEAQGIDGRVSDLRERLCTQLAAELEDPPLPEPPAAPPSQPDLTPED